MKKNVKSYFLKLLVSLLLLLFLLRFVNLKELTLLARNLYWPYLIVYFVLIFIDRLIMAYKWKILVGCQRNILFLWRKLIKVYFKGTFIGNLLPTSLGGDAVRAYELSRSTKTMVDVISSIIMERFLGFLSSALMAILVIPLLVLFVPGFPEDPSVPLGHFSFRRCFISFSPFAQRRSDFKINRLSGKAALGR